MNKQFDFIKEMCCAMICVFVLSGCSDSHTTEEKQTFLENEKSEETETEINIDLTEADAKPLSEDNLSEPEIIEADWSEYFNGLNGAAVLYNASDMQYTIFNSELALTQSAPCSTFKIISSLIALEHGIIQPDDSTRIWSGEVFWNEKWNRDIDFRDAFRDSCVWYFRQIIDDIGQEVMQKELSGLQYGNCDISDWQGRLNTNNSNPALTGFWIESSLAISPKEQTEVMERIFRTNSVYSEVTQKELRSIRRTEFILWYPVLVVIPNIQFGKNGKSKFCGNSAHGIIFVLYTCGKEIDMSVFFNISDKPAQCIFFVYLSGAGFSVNGTLLGRVKVNGIFYGRDVFRCKIKLVVIKFLKHFNLFNRGYF